MSALSDDERFSLDYISRVFARTKGREPANHFDQVTLVAYNTYFKIINAGLGGMAEWWSSDRDMDAVLAALTEIGATDAELVVRAIVEKLRSVPAELRAETRTLGDVFALAGEALEAHVDGEMDIHVPLREWIARHRQEIAALEAN